MDWLRRHWVGPRRATEPQHEAAESADSGMPTPPNSGAAAAYRRTAYVPSVVPGPFAADSGFGGQPYLAPGVTNPSCPRCDEPMPLIAQIALDAQPTPVIAGTGLLQLFYCTRERDGSPCDVALEGWEAFSPCHVSRLVAAGSGGTSPTVEPPFESKRITGWTPADDYPNWEELGALGADAGEPPDDVEPFPLEGEKLGGWPAWVQGIEYPSCPRCDTQMTLVLQVDSEKHVAMMWGDMGIGHVTQCPNHPEVLTFAWACS